MSKIVPNQFPTIKNENYRIALVGEAPGETEEMDGRPFVGASGKFLRALLSRAGISADSCFIGNVCQHRPPYNKIENFDWDGDEIQSGLAILQHDLETFKPNLCLLLGGTALRAFTGEERSIESWRGSLFGASFVAPGTKCLATYHPAAALRVYEYVPLLNFDLRRAAEEGRTPDLNLPQRNLHINLTADEILHRLVAIRQNGQPIALDIEGGILQGVSCISIATSASECFVIPFFFGQWNAWDLETECRILHELALTLEDVSVPKILQNALYDMFVLAMHVGILIRNVKDDTMMKHWELLCEVPKGLDVQASIYTKQPYYKNTRKTESREQFFTYNALDSAVTFEINDHLETQLHGESRKHYEFNVRLLPPILYAQIRGIRYDRDASLKKLAETKNEVYALQHELNSQCGVVLTVESIYASIKENLCYKKDVGRITNLQDCLTYSKPSCYPAVIRIVQILVGCHKENRPLGANDLGEISTLLSVHINVDAPKALAELLYTRRNLTPQYKKEHGRKTDRLTTDVLALLNLKRLHPDDKVLDLILKLRAVMTSLETLGDKADPDGRIRCAYNITGSETGRLTCYESPTGSGFNLQTVTKKQRHLYRADPDHDLAQCDLAGADGWTVAAHCKRAGDSTMFDDYMAGLKPALIIALIYQNENNADLSREELKELSARYKQWEKDHEDQAWLYFGCKRVYHGTDYKMGVQTMSDQILKDSYKLTGKATFVPAKVCDRIQRYMLMRYPGVSAWHRLAASQLTQHGYLVSPSGHKRIFLGRRTDDSTLKEFLAHEPQAVTTYATNKALHNIWYDPENRNPDGSLKVEVLHQVHDALLPHWHQRHREFALRKLRTEWFNNPIVVAGTQLTIPYEGQYGPSWGELKETI